MALSPSFRETLDRHGALMKQARMFRARPQVFERLLAERAGIGGREIEEFREQHSRAGKYLRSVRARTSHAARQDALHEEQGIVEAIAAEGAAIASEPAPEPIAPSRPAVEVPTDPDRDAHPDWRTLYQELKRDWNELVARSEEPDLPLLLMDGYDTLIRRVRTLAAHSDLSESACDVLDELIEYHDEETVLRETAEGFLESAESHVEAYMALEHQAGERGIPVAHLDAWPEWRDAAQMLATTGKAVLVNDERYGAYLDAMTIGKARARLTVEQLTNRLRENRSHAAKPELRQPQPDPTPKQEQGFAHILDDREKLRELREKAERRDRKRGRHMRRSRGLSM